MENCLIIIKGDTIYHQGDSCKIIRQIINEEILKN